MHPENVRNQRFSDVFKGYGSEVFVENEFKKDQKHWL